jgi:hypothetical protein
MAAEYAPIALFAFRRPDHLAACLAALAACPEAADSPLVVFCDGPRGPQDEEAVREVRAVARAATGFARVDVVEREANLGLAASVIDGVGRVLADHERVVVVEDDLVVSPDFLRYLNAGLDLYAADAEVVSIHAYVVPVQAALPQSFFLRGADCWGWATWRRGWAVFEPDGAALLQRLRDTGQVRAFDLDGAYPYSQMLERQVSGEIDSWAVRWYASAFLAGTLTLYPGRSLVENVGQDGSGTHSVATRTHAAVSGRLTGPLERVAVVESAAARAEIVRTLAREHGTHRAGLLSRLPRWMRRP